MQHGGSSASAGRCRFKLHHGASPRWSRARTPMRWTPRSSKLVKTTMGLEICVLEPMDDVFGLALHGPRLRTPTSPSTTMTMRRQR